MACSLATPCGGILREDLVFAREMALAGVRRRRLSCFNGHSLVVYVAPRHRTGRPHRTRCPICELVFERVPMSRRAGKLPVYCSRACQREGLARARRKLDPREVVRLYVQRGWSMPRIGRHFGLTTHEPVRTALRAAGVRARRHTMRQTCREPGCARRVDEALRRRRGARCRQHGQEAERRSARDYWRRRHGQGLAAAPA